MKRYFGCIGIVVLCLSLLVGLIGCTESSEDTLAETTPKVTTTGWWDILKDEYDAELTVEDMKYDMANNVDKNFSMSGYAKLSDYYNYGFDHDIEDSHFVLQVDAVSTNDDWYVYCNRKTFSKLFDDAKTNGKVYIFAICKIPKANYEKGQGAMAMLVTAEWTD